MKSEDMFSKLFRASPLALTLSSTRDNRYIEVNEVFERFTGWSRDEVIGRTPEDIGLWVDPGQRAALVRRLLAGETVRNLDFTIRMKGGAIRNALGSAELVEIEGELCMFGVAADVTEREEQFRAIANTAPVIIWLTGVDRRCTYVSQPWLELTGRSLEAELGYGWTEDLHPDDVQQCLEAYAKAFDRRESVRVEYRLRRHDGVYRWFFAMGVPRYQADGTFSGYIGSAIDISERKQLEEALSTMSQRLIDAQEEERSRLARELHDDISQRLAMLTVHLHVLQRGLPASAVELKQVADEAVGRLSDLIDDLHAMSSGLRSPNLDLLGLEAAAQSLCREFSDHHGVAVNCHVEAIPPDLSPTIALCLFRVLQEALQNAIEHSGSFEVYVSLKGDANQIELVVRDAGTGFDPNEAFKGSGLGLSSMRERLKPVGGQLSVEAKPRGGTTIRAVVPLPSGLNSDRA